MDIHKMIVELQDERQRLDQAIEALERLNSKSMSRRSRPPAWLKEQVEQIKSAAKQSDSE